MLDVKVSSRGSGRSPDISQFVGNHQGVWNGCRFHINSTIDEADVWLIVEDVEDFDTSCKIPGDSLIFLSAETSWPPGFYDTSPARSQFLDQFTWIYTCHDIFRPNVSANLPFLPWMVNANHGPSISSAHERDVDFLGGLVSLEKPKKLSVICSAQEVTPGHRMRLRFVEALQEHFGEGLEWFGNGVNPIPEKWIGLAPYKYTIAIENHIAINIATEKIWDPFLALSYPIYGGAPNIGDFLPAGSFTAMDVKDINGSIAVIEEVLEQDFYMERLPVILEARERILGPLNLYSRYAAIAERHAGMGQRKQVTVKPLSNTPNDPGHPKTVTRSIGEFINKVGDTLVQRSHRRGQ